MTKKLYYQLCFVVFFLHITTNSFSQLRPAIAWQKCIGGTANDVAKDVLITNDGKLVIIGSSYSNDGNVSGHHGTNTTSDAWIVQMDTAGNIIWQKSIGGTANDFFTTVIEAEGGGYICTGTTYSNDGDVTGNHGNGDLWAVKINTNGSIAWSKCYGGSLYDYGADVTKTGDGNYAFIGTSYSYDGDVLSGENGRIDSDGWAFKTDASGNIIWEKCLHHVFTFLGSSPVRNDIGYNITRSETGNLYALAAGTEDYQTGGFPFYDYPRTTPGILYELNNSNGSSTLIGKVNGDTIYSMYKTPTKLYFAYNQWSYNFVEHCIYADASLLGTRNDGSSVFNSQLMSWTSFNGCPGDYQDQLRFGLSHGVTEEPSLGLMMAAGKGQKFFFEPDFSYAIITLGFGMGIPRYKYGNLDGSTVEGFNSIKSFPVGNEYIVAGYANGDGEDVSGVHSNSFDFWIVKLQALNKIIGNVFVDVNNNNIKDAGELPFTDALVKTTKQGFELSAIPYNGIYRNVVDTGTYTTVLNINRPYYTATPASKVSVFTSYKNTDSANFAVHPTPGIQDYTIGLISLAQPRPGFNLQYKINYFNTGTTTLTNKLIKFVKDSRTQFLGAVPANTSISGDTIKWNIASLAPWTGGDIILNLQRQQFQQ